MPKQITCLDSDSRRNRSQLRHKMSFCLDIFVYVERRLSLTLFFSLVIPGNSEIYIFFLEPLISLELLTLIQ